MLTDEALVAARATVESAFLDVIAVTRTTELSDADGNNVGSPIDIADTTATLTERAADERPIATRDGQRIDATLSCSLDLDLKVGDTVDARSKTWIVLTVMALRTRKRAELKRIG